MKKAIKPINTLSKSMVLPILIIVFAFLCNFSWILFSNIELDKNTFRTFGAREDEGGYMSKYSFSDSIVQIDYY